LHHFVKIHLMFFLPVVYLCHVYSVEHFSGHGI